MSDFQFRAVRGPAHGEPDCVTIYDSAAPDMEGVVITAEGAAQLRDALSAALGDQEVRGYVVLVDVERGELEIRDGLLYDDRAEASRSAAIYRSAYGQTEAHVGVVTSHGEPDEE